MRTRRLPLALACALLAAGCSAAPSSPSPSAGASVNDRGVDLEVYAAASLRTALAGVSAAYAVANPGVTLTVSADSSAALEAKIEQGAPADLLLSADTAAPQRLVDRGLASGPVTAFAGNLLTVIVPAANPARIGAPADLGRPGVKVIAAADGVPIQKYTAQWLAKVALLPAYGTDFPSRFSANVASREDNVGALVAKVALGEGDAGVVYVTDAKASAKVAPIAIPAAQNVPAAYGGVVIGASPHAAAASALLSWLAGPEGQAVLASFGFSTPGG